MDDVGLVYTCVRDRWLAGGMVTLGDFSSPPPISSHLSPEVQGVLQGQGCSSQQQQSMISKSESKSRCSKGCASPGAQEGTSSSCPMRITQLHTRLLAHQLHHKLCANLVCEVPEIFGKGEGTTTARHCHFFFVFFVMLPFTSSSCLN